jgi:hypothetical protein
MTGHLPWDRGSCALRGSVTAELPLSALRAVEDELRRFVVRQVRNPALLVGRQPAGVALNAGRDQRNASCARGELRPATGASGSPTNG